MSFHDETAEKAKPATVTRVLSHLELVDVKIAWERAHASVPDAIHAFRTGDGAEMMDALGALVDGLTVIRCTLGLDDVDEAEEAAE